MELLARKYIRYFYVILLISTLIPLLNAVFMILNDTNDMIAITQIFLSVINMILLGQAIQFNIRQKFEECKLCVKILRITVIPLFILHVLCTGGTARLVSLRDCLVSMSVVELILGYRLQVIKHLEELAIQFAKENAMNEKGG